MNKIIFLLSIHQTLLMATCHFLWQASTIVYFTMLLLAMKEIHNERHYKNNFFFIKWMINTLCNLFSSKFGEKIKYVEATWVFWGKKRFLLNMTTPMQLNFFCQVMQIYYEVLCAWYQVRRHVQGVKGLCKQWLDEIFICSSTQKK
jgi:hypothetical protein